MTSSRVLGAVGTLVWDRIVPADPSAPAVEAWGGVSYSLAALAAALPDGWTVRPVVKVGRDMVESAREFLRQIPRVLASALVEVPEDNNRVELRYRDRDTRSERLSGGVPSWRPPELRSLAEDVDALYVNFISGFELDLPTALELRRSFRGPIWADLHSLLLGMDETGLRVPRPLEREADWLQCFDVIQVNESEFALMGGSGDPWAAPERALEGEPRMFAVTRGENGAEFVTRDDVSVSPLSWRCGQPRSLPPVVRRGSAAPRRAETVVDSTGCGDVWGATAFARMLAGDPVEIAVAAANEAAGRTLQHWGAHGLYACLTDDSPGRKDAS